MWRLAARSPACGQFHRAARLLLGRRIRRAFVELHDDVRAERVLDFDRALGCQEDAVTIDRRRELHALLGDLAQRRQTPDLKTAGVGENRPVPVPEAVQAAEVLLDQSSEERRGGKESGGTCKSAGSPND